MRIHWRRIVLFVVSAITLADIDAVYADDSHQCFFESIQATFTAELSTYRAEAGCKKYSPNGIFQSSNSTSMRWSSQGTYDSRTRIAREEISVITQGGTGTVTTTLSCPSDPWLGPSLEPGMVVCANPILIRAEGATGHPAGFCIYKRDFIASWTPRKLGHSRIPLASNITAEH